MTPYMDRPLLAASNIKGLRLVHLAIKLPMVAPLAHYNCTTLHITLHSTLVYYGLARLHVQSNSLHLHVYDIAGAAQYYQLSLKMHTMLLHIICYWTGLSCTKSDTRPNTLTCSACLQQPDYLSFHVTHVAAGTFNQRSLRMLTELCLQQQAACASMELTRYCGFHQLASTQSFLTFTQLRQHEHSLAVASHWTQLDLLAYCIGGAQLIMFM